MGEILLRERPICLFVCLFVCFLVCLDTESKSTCSSMAKNSSNVSDFKYAPCLFACLFVYLFGLFVWTLRAKTCALQWPESPKICMISNVY